MSSMVSKSVVSSFTCSGHLANTASVEWSPNNAIAIIINRGVYIFETHCNADEVCDPLRYHKSLIDNPNDTLILDVGINVTELLSTCTRDEQHVMMLDNTLMSDTANAPNFRCYRSAHWSPITAEYGCLLALLSLDHRLVIYRKYQSVWLSSFDVSIELNNQIKQSWSSTDSLNYLVFKDRSYSLATTAFCWANKCVDSANDGQSCVLYTASKNGLISFWQILINEQISAHLLYKWRTNFGQITAIQCFDDYLIISAYSGVVVVIHSGFCLDDSPNPLTLWPEEDQIGVYHFAAKITDGNCLDIIFTKATFVVICRIEAENIGDSITLTLKCCKSVEGLFEMPSTGICSMSGFDYLLTSMDGRMIQLQVFSDLTLKQNEISLDGIDLSGMCAYGIDCSPNAALSATALMLTVYHDHLIIKEPVQIIVFSNITFNQLSNILNEQYFSSKFKNKFITLSQCRDYLDCLRAFLASHNSFPEMLIDLINNEDINDCDDSFKLKMIRFISKAILSNCQKKINEVEQIHFKARAELCEEIILKLFIQSLFETFNSSVSNTMRLTGDQILSLKNMNSWLTQRFHEIVMNFEFECLPELCPICSEEIVYESRTYGCCVKAHRFTRCTNSMLLCDYMKHISEPCIQCQSHMIIKPPVWKQFSSNCIFCS